MNEPLRIAMIAPHPAAGLVPAESVKPKYRLEHPAPWVHGLARALSQRKDVRVAVFVHSRAVSRVHDVTSEGIRIVFVPKREPIRTDPYHLFLPGRIGLAPHLSAFKPDIVMGFGTESGCGPLAVALGYPSVVFIQGMMDMTEPFISEPRPTIALKKKFEHWAICNTDGLVAETSFARQWALRHCPGARVRIIPHTLSPVFLSAVPDFSRPVVLFVGSLTPTKGADTVIRAFALLQDTAARLVIVGSGPEGEKYRQLAVTLGVAHRVEFTGHLYRDEILRLMQQARVLALGSRMDTSPNVITEAHAAGLPVVGTRVGGIPDMVIDGQDGFIVPANDPASMAEKINALMQDVEMCRRMGTEGRRKVQVLNHPETIASAHVDFCRDIVASHALSRPGTPHSLKDNYLLRRAASVVPPAWRTGFTYRRWQRRIAEARRWTPDQIATWQLEQLQRRVRFAYEHTDGYRMLYQNAGFLPGDFRTLDDFRRLPTVTKQMIQSNLEAFSTHHARRRYVSTSGSTGIPLGFYTTPANRSVEDVFMHDSWSWVGWKPGMRSAVLRGGFIGAPDRVCSYDPYQRELRLSSYYLTPDTLPRYLEAMQRYGTRVLQAYPSSLNTLVDALAARGIDASRLFDLVLLGSENVYGWQIEKFESVFPKTRFFAWYGQAEQVILAPWCESRRVYHIRPLYSFGEILDESGRDVDIGQEGELVGTNLHNDATLFIRYRTTDRAVRGFLPCPSCGRPFLTLRSIEGRAHELIYTPSGRRISMTAVNMHDRVFDPLLQFQFRQQELGRVAFRYVPRHPLSAEEVQRIRLALSEKLGAELALDIEPVSEIPRMRSGKYSFLEQRLSPPGGGAT